MNQEHSVSWAGAEYHPDHTRCKYALSTIDLRLWSSCAFDPIPTKADLLPIDLRCISALPDPYKTRFGLFALEQWECSGEATHKGSSKTSLGLCRSDDPSILEWRRLRNLFHPSIHFRLVWSILLRTLQTVLITMRSFYLFCWWSVRSVLPTVRSVQQPTMLHHRNSSAGQAVARECQAV